MSPASSMPEAAPSASDPAPVANPRKRRQSQQCLTASALVGAEGRMLAGLVHDGLWGAVDVHKDIRHDHEAGCRLAPERSHDPFNFGVDMSRRFDRRYLKRSGSGLDDRQP
jgi:hypothetical protein